MSIGFSPSGGMAGADIVMGWVDDAGQPFLEVGGKLLYNPTAHVYCCCS